MHGLTISCNFPLMDRRFSLSAKILRLFPSKSFIFWKSPPISLAESCYVHSSSSFFLKFRNSRMRFVILSCSSGKFCLFRPWRSKICFLLVSKILFLLFRVFNSCGWPEILKNSSNFPKGRNICYLKFVPLGSLMGLDTAQKIQVLASLFSLIVLFITPLYLDAFRLFDKVFPELNSDFVSLRSPLFRIGSSARMGTEIEPNQNMSLVVLDQPRVGITHNSDSAVSPNEGASAVSLESQKSVATHTRTIGIIHPPPDVRSIIDKTSHFVAKNGPEFEKRILANNPGNAKFNFLIPSDPYHAYYQHRVSDYRTQQQQAESAQPAEPTAADSDSAKPAAVSADEPVKVDANAQFKIIPPRKVLEPPEAEQYTVRLPEGITGEELDIIKLTAQFVARNGKSFLTSLSAREANNPQFYFLKPTHSLFTFFTTLADAYSKVLMPPKGLTDKLRKGSTDMTVVLERCLHRLEWERSQEQARQKAEDEIEQERVQMAMIDWHDFVVVETIEFGDDEDAELPEPLMLDEVIRLSKAPTATAEEREAEEPVEAGKEVEMEMDEEEMQLVEEGMRAARIEEADNADERKHEMKTGPNEAEPPMRIVKNWKRPEDRIPAERDPTKFVISPITGELIPINEMAEHMRISLIDPKYKEQKERMMAKIRETTLAQDDEISRNIVGLARTRPDIFGTTEEEVSNAVKAEIEKKKDEQPKQVIWDGHSGSIGWTANQAMSQGQSTDEQSDLGNNEGKMLPGPPPPPRPGVPSVRPLPPPPGLALNIPRMPTSTIQYSAPASSGLSMPQHPRPPMMPVIQVLRPPPPPISSAPQSISHPTIPASVSVNPPIPVPPPPGHFTPLPLPRPYVPIPMPPPNMGMAPPPPMPQGMPPPPPPEEAPPPLPDEPEPKRARIDELALMPEDQFLAQHPAPVCISVALPNVDEGNLKGQVLEMTVQSLSETVGSLKEKISGEIQLPANKQKISGRAGFLKDNLTLAYYNVGPGETLNLALRERGGRKK